MAKVEVKITAKDEAAFKKDVKQFLKNKGIAVDRALDATALQIRHDALQIVPVKDGLLKNSIVVETPQKQKPYKNKSH